jgi:uncharacterized protein YwlG (UPF0340 family)
MTVNLKAMYFLCVMTLSEMAKQRYLKRVGVLILYISTSEVVGSTYNTDYHNLSKVAPAALKRLC